MTNSLTDLTMGFATQIEEMNSVALPILGKVPEWLVGDLVRNGPGKFEAGPDQYRHWFDGLAKLHKFSFANGQVKFTCKFLASAAYKMAVAQGRIVLPEFGTNPNKSFFEWLRGILNLQLTDNANVNVVALDYHYLALTETINTTEFDLSNLTTAGKFEFNDELVGQVTTAHPHFDFERQELYNLLVKLGPKNAYVIYKIKSGTSSRRIVACVDVKEPSYFHSFAASRNYIILVECPFVVNPLDVIIGKKTYVQCYSWKNSQPTRISVYSKDNGQLVALGDAEPFFCFHHVNAFEENGEVVIDLLAYADAQIVDNTYLNNLRQKDSIIPISKLRRLRTNLTTGKTSSENLFDTDIELPRIYYERYNGKKYNYVYAPGQNGGQFLNQLVKVNVENGAKAFWQQPGCYPGEPVFVPRPGLAAEDDGVLLSVVLDTVKRSSFLLILDAVSMQEVARLEVPIIIPFGFHGQFFKT